MGYKNLRMIYANQEISLAYNLRHLLIKSDYIKDFKGIYLDGSTVVKQALQVL